MKRVGLFSIALTLLGAASPRSMGGDDAPAAEPLATARRVSGVITAIEPKAITIASSQHAAVTGRIDPARTKVTVQGKPGALGDLRLTAHAKGELCLDDVWLTIDTH